jgi:hypothetical protein
MIRCALGSPPYLFLKRCAHLGSLVYKLGYELRLSSVMQLTQACTVSRQSNESSGFAMDGRVYQGSLKSLCIHVTSLNPQCCGVPPPTKFQRRSIRAAASENNYLRDVHQDLFNSLHNEDISPPSHTSEIEQRDYELLMTNFY